MTAGPGDDGTICAPSLRASATEVMVPRYSPSRVFSPPLLSSENAAAAAPSSLPDPSLYPTLQSSSNSIEGASPVDLAFGPLVLGVQEWDVF